MSGLVGPQACEILTGVVLMVASFGGLYWLWNHYWTKVPHVHFRQRRSRSRRSWGRKKDQENASEEDTAEMGGLGVHVD